VRSTGLLQPRPGVLNLKEHVKTNVLRTLGCGDPRALQPRLRRLRFNESRSLL
jgi:hypothetical protein